MTPMIICCVGRKRSGKDSFFEFVESHDINKKVLRLAFADTIKQAANNLFGHIGLNYFYDDKLKDTELTIPWSTDGMKLSPREMCTTLGSFCRNTYSENFWIDRTFSDIDMHEYDIVVITDVRYTNEIKYIQKNYLNNMIVYIDADERLGPMDPNAHESEKSVYLIKEEFRNEPFMFILENNTSLEDFHNNIKATYY
jgi:hypothetical protein